MNSVRHARTGVLAAATAACFFAVNGTVSKVVLTSGVEASRLTALRCLGAFLGLLLVLASTPGGRRRLRLTRREIPFLFVYGAVGVSLVQWLYFVAIGRLPVGVALLLEFTAPLFVALWVRFGRGEAVRNRVWLALALALGGLALVARVWDGGALDGLGVAAAVTAAVALAAYYLLGESAVGARDPLSLTCWAMFFAAAVWSVLQPWWAFDTATLGREVSLLGSFESFQLPVWMLLIYIVVGGTIVPFSLSLLALKHLPATAVGAVGMLEPVLAGAVAWLWLGESLVAVQLAGSAIVIAGIVLAQTARSGATVVTVDVALAVDEHVPAAGLR